MERCRWLFAKWPMTARKLGKELISRSFSDQEGGGFVVGRIRDSYVEAKYVERLEFRERIVDPFGTEHFVDRLEYRQSYFRASTDGLGLELYDPPRSSRLLAELQEASSFELTIADLNVDVLKWAASLANVLAVQASICAIQIGDLTLAPNVTAKLLVSGLGDVRSATEKLVLGKRAVTEKVQVRIASSASPIQLSRTGTARFPSSQSDQLIPVLRNALNTLS